MPSYRLMKVLAPTSCIPMACQKWQEPGFEPRNRHGGGRCSIWPRIFWKDTDTKNTNLGGERHGVDKGIWVFRDKEDQVCGRVGTHVDDFLIAGNMADPCWLEIREGIKKMYNWSPWRTGSFTFAGLEIQQLKDYSIRVTQENFCNALRPVEIENEKSRSTESPLTPKEISQCRGLIMKAQWRAVQTAFQYCARVGIAASALANNPTVSNLKDANSLMKELRKTAKEEMYFYNFNHGRDKKLEWHELVAVHFGDAGNNREGMGPRQAVTSPAFQSLES